MATAIRKSDISGNEISYLTVEMDASRILKFYRGLGYHHYSTSMGDGDTPNTFRLDNDKDGAEYVKVEILCNV